MTRKREFPDPVRTVRCHGRWLDEYGFLNACSNESEPGRMRCRHCAPDGAKLDRNGRAVEEMGVEA